MPRASHARGEPRTQHSAYFNPDILASPVGSYRGAAIDVHPCCHFSLGEREALRVQHLFDSRWDVNKLQSNRPLREKDLDSASELDSDLDYQVALFKGMHCPEPLRFPSQNLSDFPFLMLGFGADSLLSEQIPLLSPINNHGLLDNSIADCNCDTHGLSPAPSTAPHVLPPHVKSSYVRGTGQPS